MGKGEKMNTFRRYGSFILTVALGLLLVLGCRRSRPAYNYNYNSSPRPSATPTVNRTATPYPDVKIDRKTFSLTLPADWTEDTKTELNPDSFGIFEKSKQDVVLSIQIRKKSEGFAADKLLTEQKTQLLMVTFYTKIDEFKEWGNYKGHGFDISGRLRGKQDWRHRVFAFEQGDKVCLITESGAPVYFMHDDDFKTIRNSFKLK
jgi:hypothetical protein